MLIDLKMYSAISHGEHMITWSRHVAGISEFLSMSYSDSFALPWPRYLLQQVESAQVSTLATARGAESQTDHMKAHSRAL